MADTQATRDYLAAVKRAAAKLQRVEKERSRASGMPRATYYRGPEGWAMSYIDKVEPSIKPKFSCSMA